MIGIIGIPARTVLLTVLLAGCASERVAPAPAAGETGSATCIRSCNRAYDVCMEAGAARGGETFGGAPITGGRSCERQLRQCTAGCRTAP